MGSVLLETILEAQEMIIVHYIASAFWGGGEQYVFDLANELLQQGHRLVFVLQPQSAPLLQERFGAIGHTYTLHPTTKNGKFSFISAMQLAQIMDKEKANVLHVHDQKELFIGVWTKILLRNRIHLIANHHLVSAGKDKCLWLWAYRHVNHYIFVSEAVKKVFLSSPRVAASCATACVVHNSVRISPMKETSTSIRDQLHIPAEDTLFVYLGRICEEKGIVQLLLHLNPITDEHFHVILAGAVADNYTSEWQAFLQNDFVKKHVTYLGFRKDIANLIQQTDCGLFPSLVPESGGPLSLLEHMALGSPVIASNNGSQPEYIQSHQEGILCSPIQYTEWQEAILWMIRHPEERKQMGEKAKTKFENEYNYRIFANQIIQLYTNNE